MPAPLRNTYGIAAPSISQAKSTGTTLFLGRFLGRSWQGVGGKGARSLKSGFS